MQCNHCSDVIMSVIAPQITGVPLACSTMCSDADHRNIKALRHWPLWGESTGDRWSPLQKASNAEIVSLWSSWLILVLATQISTNIYWIRFDQSCPIAILWWATNGPNAAIHCEERFTAFIFYVNYSGNLTRLGLKHSMCFIEIIMQHLNLQWNSKLTRCTCVAVYVYKHSTSGFT